MNIMIRYLIDRNVFKRFMWMWVLSFSIFFLAWVASYQVLPQGVLRGKLPGTWLFGEDVDVVSTFLKILLFNFLIGGIVFSLCNLFRVGKVPLGYVAVWLQIFVFGVLKGTNSFIYPYETMLASFIGFLRTGLWEFTAYILMTCSTVNFAIYRQESWISSKVTKIGQWNDVKLSKVEKSTYSVGAIILLLSAFLEALAIFNVIP
jgi:hypothetical protein